MSILQTNSSLLNKFLKQFSTCFSKKQLAVFTLLIYALFKDYKRNSLDAMAILTIPSRWDFSSNYLGRFKSRQPLKPNQIARSIFHLSLCSCANQNSFLSQGKCHLRILFHQTAHLK